MQTQKDFKRGILIAGLICFAQMTAILPCALAGSSIDTLKICVGAAAVRSETGIYRVPIRLESAKEHRLFFIALTFAFHKNNLRLPEIKFPEGREDMWSYAYAVSAGDHVTDTLRIALLRQKTFQNELGELLQVEFEALTDSLHAPICQMAAAKIEGQLDSTFILVEQANSVKPNSPASASLPLEFALRQNYPNPFNAGTTIAFQLPWSAAVNIRILNSLGEVVAVLADKSFDAGKHEVSWSGKNHAREEVASGVYFCEIHAGSFVQRHKMLLLR